MEAGRRSSYWAFQLLHIGFTVIPVVAGLDKFTYFLTDWNMYLSQEIIKILPFSPNLFIRGVGVVEITAGLIVAVKPRLGGLIVCLWLIAIIVNLLLTRTFYDIALRDLGLALGALSLFLLSRECACKA